MSDQLDDLFDDDEEQQEQQQQPEAEPEAPAGSPEGEPEGDAPEDLLDPQPAADADEQELFGGGSDEEEQPAPAAARGPVPRGPAVEVAAPLISRPPKDQSYLLKLTNIVGVEPRPFHPDTYTTEKDIYYDASGHRRVRLRDSNVIRWRYAAAPDGSLLRDEAGALVKESNARVIRWSDGSETLQLGGEMLALSKQNIQGDNAYLYAVHYDIIQVGGWGVGRVWGCGWSGRVSGWVGVGASVQWVGRSG
jgi:RNA polymerase-associated protein LEO1